MDHFKQIYQHQAGPYHRMIAAEDVDGNLERLLKQHIIFAPTRIVLDLGSGTGRLPLLLRDSVPGIVGSDLYRAMLLEQQSQRSAAGGNWPLLQADMRTLPFTTASADVILAGWAMGHLRSWYEGEWQAQMSRILHEMRRVLKPGGALVIMETMTTGSHTPAPPNVDLAEYYHWLETEWGFKREVIATDYLFKSVDDAADCMTFFFGEQMREQIIENQWRRVPEWTGVWFWRG